MKNLRFILLAMFVLTNFYYCSSDDDKGKDDDQQGEVTDGGTVYTSKLVLIEMEGLSGDVYEAEFNDQPITLANNNQGALVFFVSPEIAKIDQDNYLEITSLDMKIKYTVAQTALPGSAEETLAPFIDHLNNTDTTGFDQGDKVDEFIDSFNEYYASLSDAEKHSMAEFYQANKDLLDGTLQKTMKDSEDFLGLSECQQAQWLTATLGASAAILSSNPATMGLSVLSGAGAIVAFKSAVESCTGFMNEKLRHAFAKFNDLFSDKQEEDLDYLAFNSGQQQSFAMKNGMRGIQESDAGDGNAYLTSFFSFVNEINDLILSKLNVVIAWCNDHLPSFFQIEPFDTPIDVPQTAQPEEQLVTQETFSKYSFTVADNNVSISSVNFNAGNINITLDIIDPAQNEISTTLNYIFHDDLNNHSGSFPVVVTSACAGSDLAVTATANGNSATATATGGVPPYTYSWSNGATGETATGLAPGSYTITVTDANGCSATASVVVEDNPEESSGEIQFTLSGEYYTFPDGQWQTQYLYGYSQDEYCPYGQVIYHYDSEGYNDFRFGGNKLIDLMNSPIGTVFQFGGKVSTNDSEDEWLYCDEGDYISINMTAPEGSTFGTSPNNTFSLYGWDFDSLAEHGTFTKTGENSFSFSGTMFFDGNIDGQTNSYYTFEISGSGTFIP